MTVISVVAIVLSFLVDRAAMSAARVPFLQEGALEVKGKGVDQIISGDVLAYLSSSACVSSRAARAEVQGPRAAVRG